MYKMGIIEESLSDKSILMSIEKDICSKRTEQIPGDEYPIWHINKYRLDDKTDLSDFMDRLSDCIKKTWYVHIFSQTELYVVMYKKWFKISVQRDETWNEMIKYGTEKADIESRYLEDIPLSV